MLDYLWTGAGTSLSFTMETNTIPYNMHTHTGRAITVASSGDWKLQALGPVQPAAKH